ncbi:MAG TPA: deoxyhypusine synthase [Candidatus Pacearchaeota archaeon]|nr:deoxyhypusine synthase [Candidatus Pacearchaeota archaeon]
MKPVKDINIKEGETIKNLVKQMHDSGGFMAKNLAVSVDILNEFIHEKDCLRFLSFPADIISTGTRGVIKDMVKNKFFDVIITTCGTLDHDLARAFKDYHHGSFSLDDGELYKKKMHRLGNVVIPMDSYGKIIETKVKEFLADLIKDRKEISTHELCWEIGKKIDNEGSILYWAYKNKIPVIVPGITDGSVGYNIWELTQNKDFKFDILKDETLLSNIVWNSKKRAALILGGGISKHHVIWWNQFKNGLDYAVYITTAQEYDGSLSGAKPREAISWGKINEKAKYVTLYGDITLTLPIIYAALI